MFLKTHVLHTFLDTYVKHALLNLYVYHALNVRLTWVFQIARFKHGAQFAVYTNIIFDFEFIKSQETLYQNIDSRFP